jgi:hypothetical protein
MLLAFIKDWVAWDDWSSVDVEGENVRCVGPTVAGFEWRRRGGLRLKGKSNVAEYKWTGKSEYDGQPDTGARG